MKLSEKYRNHGKVGYRIVAEAPKPGTSKMPCSLCGNPVNERVDPGADEVICHLCLMGMSDYIEENKGSLVNLEELLDSVKEGKLERYRMKYGLTRGFLGRYLHISPKYLQRVEKLKDYPIDRLVKVVKKMIETVHSA